MKPSKIRRPFPRVREETLGLTNVVWHCWMITSTGQHEYGPNPAVPYRSYKRMEDTVVPGYQQLVANGAILNNSMSKVQTLYEASGDTGFEAKYNTNANYKWWSAPGWADMSLGLPAPRKSLQRVNEVNLRSLAQTAALAGVQAPVNQSLVSIGELSKSLKLLVSPLRGLHSLLKKSEQEYRRDLRKYGNRLNGIMKYKTHKARRNAVLKLQKEKPLKAPLSERLEFIPDMVLAYNLGWKPLMMEVDAVIHKIPALEEVVRRTSRSTKSDKTSWTENVVHTNLSASGQNGTFRYTYTEECIVRAGVMYADGFDPRQHFGVRLSDVPSALWELTPFSFVADYVVNLGDYIQATTNVMFSRSFLATFCTTTIKTTVSREWVGLTMPAGYTLTRLPVGVSTTSYEAKTRSPAGFGPQLAHTPLFDWSHRPPAQLQNVLSLLTKFLMGKSTWAAR